MINNSIFIHIPKTAGKWVGYTLGLKHNLHSKRKIKRIVKNDVHVCFYHQIPSWLLRNGIVPEEFVKKAFIYAFCRNPFDWLVSHYFYAKYRKKRPYAVNIKNFLEFTKIARDIKHKDYGYNALKIRGIDYIFQPQYEWVKDINVDFIGRFENLNEDVKKISKILDLKIKEVPPLNKTEHKPYFEYYNDEAIENVINNYKEDFEFFGYEKELKNGMPNTS